MLSFIGYLLLLGIITVSNAYLLKTIHKIILLLCTPKPQIPLPPPLYMSYERCIVILSRHITKTMQRVYVSHILPRLSTATGKISLLSPNDIDYEKFVVSIVLQAHESMDAYLKKSIYFYFDIKNTDNNDPGMICLTKIMTDQIIAELDHKIVENAEYIERNGPSTAPYINAVSTLAQTTYGIDRQPQPRTRKPSA